MADPLPIDRTRSVARHPPAGSWLLLLVPALGCAATPDPAAEAAPAALTEPADTGATVGPDGAPPPGDSGPAAIDRGNFRPPRHGPPPHETPGVPSDAELEAAHAVIGLILIDNENIFDVNDPGDDRKLFRLANRLHRKTRPSVIRKQLLFRSGKPYDRRQLDESERILRADGYFYDAWIRPISYHNGVVDVRVTTRDVWTLNPGFNLSRSGGSTSTGVQIQDISFLGSGVNVRVSHSHTIDRTSNSLSVYDQHAFGGFTAAGINLANNSDGYQRELTVQQPFYSLNTNYAAGIYTIHDKQTDSLWDQGQIIDQFVDVHQGAQVYGGWSQGLQNGWVRRWSTGLTYDQHSFSPVSTWTGPTEVPEDRRFLYPWVQFDLVQDDYLRLWNHDQIARTEDFYLGTSVSTRVGFADSGAGSSQTALLFTSNASTGFRSRNGASTLLFFWDFSGRVTNWDLNNGLMDANVRYYVEQSKNWLFFSTLSATKGWNLDLDNQILLGGDNGLRGYPLRYQDGTGRALFTVEQRYFTDWYIFRLFRVGAAIFADTGHVWGNAPLAPPNLGQLSDAGFGLRFGNSRSGLGNVTHVDLAFPFNGGNNIKRVQLLIQTEQSF